MATRWKVPPAWQGETVAVLASGPSMNRATCERLRGRCRVIAISNQGIATRDDAGVVHEAFAPWADVLYSADAKWWNHHREAWRNFPGWKVTIGDGLPYAEILMLQSASSASPIDPRPTHLNGGGHSGYGAVCLAGKLGARRILLFGYDLRAHGKRQHWFGNHPVPLFHRSQNYAGWIKSLSRLEGALAKLGVVVVNCTPGSAYRTAKTSTLDAEFPALPTEQTAMTAKSDEQKVEKMLGDESLTPGQWYDVTARAIVRKTAGGRMEFNTCRVQIREIDAPGSTPPVGDAEPEPKD